MEHYFYLMRGLSFDAAQVIESQIVQQPGELVALTLDDEEGD